MVNLNNLRKLRFLFFSIMLIALVSCSSKPVKEHNKEKPSKSMNKHMKELVKEKPSKSMNKHMKEHNKEKPSKSMNKHMKEHNKEKSSKSMKEHMKEHAKEKPSKIINEELKNIKLNANEVMILVNGIVCSFCSQGIKRKLSKFKFIDRSKYNKGVKMDIEKQRCTIALKPGSQLDIKAIYKAIRNGGYEPVKSFISDASGKVIEYKEGAKK